MNFKNLKLALLIFVEYVKRNKKWLILAILAISLLLLIQYKFKIFFQTNYLRMGLVGTYQEYDIPIDVTRLTSSALVVADSEGRMGPGLAQSWDVNNDATEFKFKLRENLSWVDGTPLLASDLEIAIPNAEFNVLDNRTIHFKLKEPYSPFPSLLTKPLFKKGTLLGTGPYKIAKVEKSKIFITKLTLNSYDQNLPNLYIRFYPNETVAKTGFNMGEIQVLIGPGNPSLGIDNPQVKFKQETDFSKVVVILYSLKDSLVSNRSVRQALSFASPKIAGEEIANNPYALSSWAYNKDTKRYLSNIEEAKLALGRAKSAVSEDKLKGELILTATPNLEDVAKKIESSWRNLGFDVKLRIESGVPQNFQALLITQGIPLDPDQYFLWHSSQEKTNLTKYSSLRVDKDLEEGRKVITLEDRKQNYFNFQRTLLEDAPATFLYFPKHNIIYLKKVEKLLDKVLSISN